MKYNLNQPFVHYSTGEPIILSTSDGKGKPATLASLAIDCLMIDTEQDKDTSGSEKLDRFSLAMYIRNTFEKGEVDLGAEDVALIARRAATVLSTPAYGALIVVIDPKDKSK